jgi:NAD-dependent deacetylase
VLFTIGTSAVVYPAAGIPILALQSGAYVVEINPEETPLTRYVHESIRASSGEVMPEIISRLRALHQSSSSPDSEQSLK